MKMSEILSKSFSSEIMKSCNSAGTHTVGTTKSGDKTYKYFVVAKVENDLGIANSKLFVFWSSKKDIAGKSIDIDINTWECESTTFTNDEGVAYVTNTIRPCL